MNFRSKLPFESLSNDDATGILARLSGDEYFGHVELRDDLVGLGLIAENTFPKRQLIDNFFKFIFLTFDQF